TGTISQHALGGVVEVTVGSQSVLLPCRYSGVIPEEPVVTWTNGDVDPSYRKRASLVDSEVRNGDASLVLTDINPGDSGVYECLVKESKSMRRRRGVLSDPPVSTVNLQVKLGWSIRPNSMRITRTGWS
uniref:Ig-like domain-containing protein n=1 Tax=Poecilia mexicana TaxID=48701 RepID=A0A3B3Y524_9TELE